MGICPGKLEKPVERGHDLTGLGTGAMPGRDGEKALAAVPANKGKMVSPKKNSCETEVLDIFTPKPDHYLLGREKYKANVATVQQHGLDSEAGWEAYLDACHELKSLQ